MTYENCCTHIVLSEKKMPFYGIELNCGSDWIVVDKINFIPVDYFSSNDEFEKKYTIVWNSYMKIGGTSIQLKCLEIVKGFIPEVFKHCMYDNGQNDDSIESGNWSAIIEMYRSKAKRILQKIKGKPVHFKPVSYRDVYIVPEDIIVDHWSDETCYFPEFKIQGSMIMTDYWNLNVTFNIEKKEEFFGYADDIILKDKTHQPQNFEIIDNMSNALCLELESKYKSFMETLRQSIPYNKILEAEKKK
jgi:hypothetical protein